MNSKETYSSKTFILLQDLSLSLFGSLLAMLVARWIADPIPSFTALTLKWLVFSLIASFSGVILAGSHRKQILAILMLSASPLSGKEKRREKKRMKRKRAKKRKTGQRRRQPERERKTAAMEQKKAELPNPTAAEGREEKAGNRAEKEEGRG